MHLLSSSSSCHGIVGLLSLCPLSSSFFLFLVCHSFGLTAHSLFLFFLPSVSGEHVVDYISSSSRISFIGYFISLLSQLYSWSWTWTHCVSSLSEIIPCHGLITVLNLFLFLIFFIVGLKAVRRVVTSSSNVCVFVLHAQAHRWLSRVLSSFIQAVVCRQSSCVTRP